MTRATWLTVVAAVVVAAGALAFRTLAWADEPAGAKVTTLKGEIVDLHCFMIHPDKGIGADHAKCASQCIEKGLPAGLLADGQVYLLLSSGHESVKGEVAAKAGQTVTLEGTVLDHNGMKAFQIKGEAKDGGHEHGEHH